MTWSGNGWFSLFCLWVKCCPIYTNNIRTMLYHEEFIVYSFLWLMLNQILSLWFTFNVNRVILPPEFWVILFQPLLFLLLFSIDCTFLVHLYHGGEKVEITLHKIKKNSFNNSYPDNGLSIIVTKVCEFEIYRVEKAKQKQSPQKLPLPGTKAQSKDGGVKSLTS